MLVPLGRLVLPDGNLRQHVFIQHDLFLVQIHLDHDAAQRRDHHLSARRIKDIHVADLIRAEYIDKFAALADGVLEPVEVERFLDAAQRLPELPAGRLAELTVSAPAGLLATATAPEGIF